MPEEKRINIVRDENGIIDFEDIVVRKDSINRDEVTRAEEEYNALKTQKENLLGQVAEIEEKLAQLDEKLAYARNVIAIADAKKSENEVQTEEVPEVMIPEE